jgi:hypothetical protein
MAVDVVVVSYNTRDLLRACLNSIHEACQGTPVRTIVVDNGSLDGSRDLVRGAFPEVNLIAMDRNVGFGAANNRGMRAGAADYILFLNSDAELKPGAVCSLAAVLDQYPECVAVGPRLIYPDGRFQPSCRRFPTLLRSFWMTAGLHRRFPDWMTSQHSWLSESEHRLATAVDMVSGACFLIRRSYLESIGGFDENVFFYEEEMDLFLPARRRGLTVRYCVEAEVIHHHGASSGIGGPNDTALYHLYRSKYYVFRKHYGGRTAFLTYAGDRAVFTLSRIVNRLRGTPSEAARNVDLCRRGYQGSLAPRA